MRKMKWAALAAATTALFAATAEAQTLKVVMHSDVKIVDPIWTTAYIVRNYGYMVYDTLLAVDDKLDVKPQMLERGQQLTVDLKAPRSWVSADATRIQQVLWVRGSRLCLVLRASSRRI